MRTFVARFPWVFCALLAQCGDSTGGDPVEVLPAVSVAPAGVREFTSFVETTEEIRAHRDASIRAESNGRIVAVYCETGDAVQDGQVLARLDVGRAQAAVAAANAGVEQARARLERAIRERELADRLTESGSMPQSRRQDAIQDEELARAVALEARAQARAAARGVTDAIVRAPFAGVIAERTAELGEYVAAGTQIARLVDAAALHARVLLDPRETSVLGIGTKATWTVDSRPGQTLDATVTRIGSVLDARTHRQPVELSVSAPDNAVLPGMVARFRLPTSEPRSALAVEDGAVMERFGLHQVLVVEASTAHVRPVRIGAEQDGYREIVDGLRAGEVVITNGVDRVVDGRPVRVIPASTDGTSLGTKQP